jgi:hypothetical protein
MRFPVFLLGLGLASMGAGLVCLLMGWGGMSALGMMAATFLLGQVLYVGLIALMLRDEARLARVPAEATTPSATGTGPAANHRAS